MHPPALPYSIFPLGDSALLLEFGNTINEAVNKEIITRFRQLQLEPIPGMIEAIPAYSSLAIQYNICTVARYLSPGQSAFDWMRDQLEIRLQQTPLSHHLVETLLEIPVCYDEEYAPDISALALAKELTVDEVIRIHTQSTYKVYMIGFLPGFPYMGEVDEKISMSRKSSPQNVLPGGVGIAGRQTGIYPLASPGGWQIIGRTPLALFHSKRKEPALLKAGDRVQFYPITSDEYKNF